MIRPFALQTFATYSTSNRNQIMVIIQNCAKLIDEIPTLPVRPDSCWIYILSTHFLKSKELIFSFSD